MKTKTLVLIGVLIVALAAMAMPVMAGTTATITGNIAGSMDVNVDTVSVALGDISASGDHASSGETIDITTNYIGWAVTAEDNMDDAKTAGSEGKLTQYTTATTTYGSNVLTNALKVAGETTGDATAAAQFSLSGTGQTVYSGTVAGTFSNVPVTFTQTTVTATDKPLASGQTYRIIVTFAGGPT